MKFVILLHSKYTGQDTHLGASYATRDAAESFVRTDVCLRCNRYSIHRVPNDWQWRNRKIGFGPIQKEKVA